MPISRRDAEILDAQDKLAFARARFDLPRDVIYLDGNSLGALPANVASRVETSIRQEWGSGLVRSWNSAGWYAAPSRIGAKLAPLLGAAPHEVIIADTISINLYKVLVAAARMRPGRKTIVAERENFPSDNHIIDSVARMLGLRVRYVDANAMAAAIDDDTALIELSHVSYRSAETQDMRALTSAAHAKGALAVWDLAHSSGAVALALDADQVDFAVGCGYKFLNGGPGAPAHVYVAERHLPSVDQPLTGWFSHRAPFDFGNDFERVDGIKSMLCSTPPMLSMLAFEAALEAYDGIAMTDVQSKGRALGDFMIALFDARLAALDFRLASPRDSKRRGCHVSMTHPESHRIMQTLISRGIIGDFRAPDVMRFGFGPLYLRFTDVYDAVAAVEDIVQSGAWKEVAEATEGSVT